MSIAIDLIKAEEAFRSCPYRCSENKLTVGWGFNIQDNPFSPEELSILFKHQPMSVSAANEILERRVTAHENWLKFVFGDKYTNLSDERKAVLLSMIYQLGRSGFLGFRDFNMAWQKGDWSTAADELIDSKAFMQTPKRYERMANIMLTGKIDGFV